jgi:hypothetical protein
LAFIAIVLTCIIGGKFAVEDYRRTKDRKYKVELEKKRDQDAIAALRELDAKNQAMKGITQLQKRAQRTEE